MAKTLEKTRKQIAKKRNGNIDALHGKSRDSKRLHRAQVRDDRLEKIAETRRKKDKPLRSCSLLFFLGILRQTNRNKLPVSSSSKALSRRMETSLLRSRLFKPKSASEYCGVNWHKPSDYNSNTH